MNGCAIDPVPNSFLDDRQYRLLVEAVADYAIYMIDVDGVVASWNTGAERFKGYAAADIIGRNFEVFYTMEDRAKGEPERALRTAARVGRFESEGWRVRQDGTRFSARVVIVPIHDGGRLVGFAKVTRDISERKEAQRALLEANAALTQSKKMEAVGQLAGGIAHDFNNVITSVLGSLELLRKRLPGDTNMKRLLDKAVQGARRGTALTQRMLAFARKQDLAPERVDLSILLRGITSLLQSALGPRVSLQTRLPPKLDGVLIDFNQLELALLNLVVNARDAMPDGGTIKIDARDRWLMTGDIPGLAAGFYACVAVQDSGVGMDAVTLSRAVEPYFSTKEAGHGTGLGLSMVHGMAIQANGMLVLKSNVGVGTTAELWFPLVSEGSIKSDTARLGTGLTSMVPGRVLVLAVDDDPLALLNVVAILDDLGHTVFEARSGEQGLAVLEREPAIELVITDMAMPNMTGVEFYLKARRLYPNLKFLLATEFGEVSGEVEPMLPRIMKPFWQNDLAKAVEAILASRPSAGGFASSIPGSSP
jgi:PAS domain S-box-containing protein